MINLEIMTSSCGVIAEHGLRAGGIAEGHGPSANRISGTVAIDQALLQQVDDAGAVVACHDRRVGICGQIDFAGHWITCTPQQPQKCRAA